MLQHLGRVFPTLVRSQAALRKLIAADPFAALRPPANAKRIVTFLRAPPKARVALPPEVHGARILAVDGREIFSAYLPTPKGPVFMALIEKTFGKMITTRTWETIRKCADA